MLLHSFFTLIFYVNNAAIQLTIIIVEMAVHKSMAFEHICNVQYTRINKLTLIN